jgi:hypothetical protein
MSAIHAISAQDRIWLDYFCRIGANYWQGPSRLPEKGIHSNSEQPMALTPPIAMRLAVKPVP